MSEILIKAEKLSKRFLTFRRERTAFQLINSLIKRNPLQKELWVLKGLSFYVKKGEKLAIVGKNGSGKTTLLRILAGIYSKTSGFLEVKDNPEALFNFWTGFNGELSVQDNVYLFGAIHGIGRKAMSGKMDKILETAGLCQQRFSLLKELSEGQIQKTALSVFFQVDSDFLIFDENLAFIDRDFEKRCEKHFQGLFSPDKTVIMASHRSWFLKKYCQKAIWLNEGSIRMEGKTEDVLAEYQLR